MKNLKFRIRKKAIEDLNGEELDGFNLSISYFEKAPNQLMANKAEVIDHIYLKVIFLNKLDNDVSTKDTLFQFNNYL